MSDNFCVHSSNQMEILFSIFKEKLYENSRPFTKRLCVVPSPVMRSWLLTQLALDGDTQVAMGVQMTYIDPAITRLSACFPLLQKERRALPTDLEMALALENELGKTRLTAGQNFLNTGSEIKDARRSAELSCELAPLFRDYGLYGAAMIEKWRQGSAPSWQSKLFLSLYKAHTQWTTPFDHVKACLAQAPCAEDMQVHLFGLNFLPPLYLHFFRAVAKMLPVHLYLLSPCAHYWGDAASDGELKRLRKQWRDKGFSEEQQLELEDYFQDRHVLLANLGKLGRKMLTAVDEESGLGIARYQPARGTLLAQLQNDMLDLALRDEKLAVEETASIEWHVAPCRRREIEILTHNLLYLIDRDGMKPSDIIVMAPDITPYVPFIRACFENGGTSLDYQIYDLKLSSQNSFIQGFQQLLSLPKNRFDAVSVLQLFEHPAVMKKLKLSAGDLKTIAKWVKETRINWGLSASHRNEVLEAQEQGENGGSWERGLHRLVLGLIASDDPSSVPYDNIEMTSAPLLSVVLETMNRLKEALSPFCSSEKKALHEWARLLKELQAAFFSVDGLGDQAVEEEQNLLEIFSRFERIKAFGPETKFSWAFVEKQLEKAFSEQSMNFRESHIGGVKFCSLLPMRAVPAKVVALIGMEEGVFPKIERPSPLNELTRHPETDYVPKSKDYDRSLFLEALLSARQTLLLSHAEESEESRPSVLILELMNALDSAYHHRGKAISECVKVVHPFRASDPLYFQNKAGLRNFSPLDFAAARSTLAPKENRAHFFSELLQTKGPQASGEESLSLTISDLTACSKNPLKMYFNHHLGMDIQEKDDISDEDPFSLDPLDRHHLRQMLFTSPLDKTIEAGKEKGLWPSSLFQECAVDKFSNEGRSLQAYLGGHDLAPDDYFTVEFDLRTKSPQKVNETLWLVPAMKAGPFTLTGALKDVTKEGLCRIKNHSIQDLFELWPQILILNHLAQVLPVKTQLLLTKERKTVPCAVEDHGDWLEKYCAYVDECRRRPSPLLPEWVDDLIKGKSVDEKVSQQLARDERKTHNKTLLYCMRRKHMDALSEENQNTWKEALKTMIPLDHALFQKGRR